MSARTSSALLLVALCACNTGQPDVTQPNVVAAADRSVGNSAQYQIVTLVSLGGRSSRGDGINERGSVAGFSALARGTRHAALWRNASVTDLGTLGGLQSSVVWPGINERGVVTGISETADLDSLHESWSCSAFLPVATGHVCRGFVWENGHMTGLPTLGGTNGFATEVNDRGQVVGWAETRVHDPTCNAPQVLQFRAVLWERGRAHELRPLRGDSTSAATAINERGQVVGISGACDVAVGEFSARHAVIWNDGRPEDIGNFGGVAWNTPMDINEAGDVVGFADSTGDANGVSKSYAFLWTRRHGIKNLGVLPGDNSSQASGINNRGEIVGISCNDVGCRGFIWKDGRMTNLQRALGASFPDSITSVQHINDSGRITGRLVDHSTGALLAFVGIPTERH